MTGPDFAHRCECHAPSLRSELRWVFGMGTVFLVFGGIFFYGLFRIVMLVLCLAGLAG